MSFTFWVADRMRTKDGSHLLANLLPDDPGHLIAIQFDDGILNDDDLL